MPDRLVTLILPEQGEVLRHALADAVYYRDPPVECSSCEKQGELCDACVAGLAQARAYLALGRELGMEPSQ
jgi:hypothetical protein